MPLPRPTRRRPGRGWFIKFVHVFFLPHCLAGIYLLVASLGYLALLLLTNVTGNTVPGKVARLEAHPGKSVASYSVAYVYRIGGRHYGNETRIDGAGFKALREGADVPVRTLSWAPAIRPVLLVAGTYYWADVALWIGSMLFWNTIVGIFVWGAYVQPLRRRALVRHGLASAATILEKEVLRGKSPTYRVRYRYSVPAVDTSAMVRSKTISVTGSMDVLRTAFEKIDTGDRLTVLYDPKHPRRSILYACADYTVR